MSDRGWVKCVSAGGCEVKGYVVNSQACSAVVSLSSWMAGGLHGGVDGCFLPPLSSPSLQRKREWRGSPPLISALLTKTTSYHKGGLQQGDPTWWVRWNLSTQGSILQPKRLPPVRHNFYCFFLPGYVSFWFTISFFCCYYHDLFKQ